MRQVKVIGQEKLKRITEIFLLANLDSLLIVGPSGSGKSLFVSNIEKIYRKKIYKLPLGASDDMIFGSISIEDILKNNKKTFQAGLLERANGQTLFIDNINLFPEEGIKEIIDSVEYKRLNIQRDSYSIKKPLDLKLICAMNYEEGYLSPTILEKFSLYIELKNIKDLESRKEIIKENLSENPRDFDESLLRNLEEAKKRFDLIKISDQAIAIANEIYASSNAQGYRGLFALLEAAKAICALDDKRTISKNELLEAAEYTLKHRKNKKDPKPPSSSNKDKNQEDNKDKNKEDGQENKADKQENKEETRKNPSRAQVEENQEFSDIHQDQEKEDDLKNDEDKKIDDKHSDLVLPTKTYKTKNLFDFKADNKARLSLGRRIKTASKTKRGFVSGSRRPLGSYDDIHIYRTIMAGILDGAYDRSEKKLNISSDHFRIKKRKSRRGASIIFLVDSSASMNAKKRMVESKNAILSLLQDSYTKRDQVAMISFSGKKSEILLPFTSSYILAKRELENLETKGKTPLSDGLFRSLDLVRKKRRKDPDTIPIIILLTDGRPNVGNIFKDDPLEDAKYVAKLIREERIFSVVIDTENSFIKLGLAKVIAGKLAGRYYQLEEIEAKQIKKIASSEIEYSISRVEIGED